MSSKVWEVQRNHLRILGNNAVLLPAIELNKHLNLDWPISCLSLYKGTSEKIIKEEFNEISNSYIYIKPSRLLGEPSNTSIQSHTDIFGVAIALGLTKGNPVTKAVAYQLILPNNTNKVTHNSIFDLSKLSTDLQAIGNITHCSYTGRNTLAQYHPIWPLFNTTDLDILYYIKNGKLSGNIAIDIGNFIESFEPNTFSLFRCLHEQLNQIYDESFTLDQARKILGINWKDAQALIQKSILNYTQNEKKKLIKGGDILKVLKTWVLLPRICKIHGLNRTTVRLELERLGFTPSISTNIYNKNRGLVSAIHRLKKLNV